MGIFRALPCERVSRMDRQGEAPLNMGILFMGFVWSCVGLSWSSRPTSSARELRLVSCRLGRYLEVAKGVVCCKMYRIRNSLACQTRMTTDSLGLERVADTECKRVLSSLRCNLNVLVFRFTDKLFPLRFEIQNIKTTCSVLRNRLSKD